MLAVAAWAGLGNTDSCLTYPRRGLGIASNVHTVSIGDNSVQLKGINMVRQFNKQTQDELAEYGLCYVVLVIRSDNSKACYGPMTHNQAVLAKTKLEQGKITSDLIQIIYLTATP